MPAGSNALDQRGHCGSVSPGSSGVPGARMRRVVVQVGSGRRSLRRSLGPLEKIKEYRRELALALLPVGKRNVVDIGAGWHDVVYFTARYEARHVLACA